MKTKVYISKLDDEIVLAKKQRLFDIEDLYLVTKRWNINKKSYLVDYVILGEAFKTHYVYVGKF